jgi:hypothetical protein
MESQNEIEITEKDVIGLMDQFTKIPAILLKGIVTKNANLVKTFEAQIETYKSQLSDEEIAKIKKVTEMPVPELQEILNEAYAETGKEQLKILADPNAEPFITKNLQELKKTLF